MIDILNKSRELRSYKVEWMILNPKLWAEYPNNIALTWHCIEFDASKLQNVPDDCCGVYSFVAIPGIANHISCSYLLYIGQTTRNFRTRYREYLRDQDPNSNTKRFHIFEMLNNWKGYLWFCYAPISQKNLIVKTEEDLYNAYVPPYCRDLRGKIQKPIRVLR